MSYGGSSDAAASEDAPSSSAAPGGGVAGGAAGVGALRWVAVLMMCEAKSTYSASCRAPTMVVVEV